MGLIDLKTDLKSLKYGDGSFGDKRGNGWSGQPYITTDIPEEPEGARTDFLLRQGALVRSGRDVSRITQFLFDTKNLSGFGFIGKQTALSLLNPIVVGRPNRNKPFTGLYYPQNTIAQVAGNALGLHLEKQGLLPIFDDNSKYLQLTREYNEESTNKLTILYNNKIQNKPVSPTGASLYGIDNLNSNNLFNYLGGPGGIKTIISVSSPTVKETDNENSVSTLKSTPDSNIRQTNITGSFGKISLDNKLNGYNTSEINRATAKSSSFDHNKIITDPLTQIQPTSSPNPNQDNKINITNIGRVLGLSSKYNNNDILDSDNNLIIIPVRANAQPSSSINPIIINPDNQITTGSSSSPNNQNFPLYKPTDTAGKSIIPSSSPYGRSKTVSYLINTSSPNTNPNLYTSTNQNTELEDSDIIKFYIEVINNDSLQSEYLYFRAYIDEFSDGFSSTWNETKYVGRAENFYTYGGFNRNINLGFTIYAHSETELKPIYTKLNQLAGIVSPDYSGIGFMRGTYVKLTVGDYLKSVPGIIKGFKIDGLLDGGWEIKAGEQLPKHIKISGMEFQPIHNFVPRKNAPYFNA
jgi:hypothetical protein